MKTSVKPHASKAKPKVVAKRKPTRRAKAHQPVPPSLTNQLVTQLDRVERSIQSLQGIFAQADEAAKSGLGTERLHKIERLAALADRSKAGSDALAAPPKVINPVPATLQPPAEIYVPVNAPVSPSGVIQHPNVEPHRADDPDAAAKLKVK